MRDITSKLPADFVSHVIEHQTLPQTTPGDFRAHQIEAWFAEALETVEAVAKSVGLTYHALATKLLPDELRQLWGTMILSGEIRSAGEIASAMPTIVRPEVIRDIEAGLRRQAPWQKPSRH